MSNQEQRLKNVNEFIQIIGNCGRRFFHDRAADAFASMELDPRGRVWFIDDYTKERIYTHYTRGRWKGFSHGGTMRDLVCFFRNHIKKGSQMRNRYFDPDWYIGGMHHWGYPEEALKVLHREGIRLGIISKEPEKKL